MSTPAAGRACLRRGRRAVCAPGRRSCHPPARRGPALPWRGVEGSRGRPRYTVEIVGRPSCAVGLTGDPTDEDVVHAMAFHHFDDASRNETNVLDARAPSCALRSARADSTSARNVRIASRESSRRPSIVIETSSGVAGHPRSAAWCSAWRSHSSTAATRFALTSSVIRPGPSPWPGVRGHCDPPAGGHARSTGGHLQRRWKVDDAMALRPAFEDARRRDYGTRLSDDRSPGSSCRSGVAIAAPEGNRALVGHGSIVLVGVRCSSRRLAVLAGCRLDL
jgi:hypothetical protein